MTTNMGKGRGKEESSKLPGWTPVLFLSVVICIATFAMRDNGSSKSREMRTGHSNPVLPKPWHPQKTNTNTGGGTDDDSVNDVPVAVEAEPPSAAELAEIEKEVHGLRQMLETYYKSPKPLDETWGYPQNPEGLDHIGEKIARAVYYKQPFVIGVIGSSVAAGHDNCNYDSFEKQLERTIGPVFEKAGVNFEVRNAGEGGACGDNMENQIFCGRHMVGDDVDIIIYSWTYFEAGWDKTKKLANIHEYFARWSLLMDRSPTPQFVNVGELSTPPKLWDSLIKRYSKYGTNVVFLQKYINTLGYERKWAEVGDKMHTTTRYGENETATRKKSLGVVFRNWHPGPLGFQLVADTLAWQYSSAFLKGLALLKDGGGPKLGKNPPLLMPSTLPQHECVDVPFNPSKPGLVHKAKWCETEEPPSCVNHEAPTFGRAQIGISTGDSLNPWFGKYVEDAKADSRPESEKIPREERDLAMCKHLDSCDGYTSKGFISYRLPRIEVGFIAVCCFGVKKCGEAMQNSLTFYLDTTKLTTHVGPDKCVTLQESWGKLTNSGGHLYLGIDMKNSSGIILSHVMAI
eukprot:m.28184 g.28184  ORF g.28184 m.28184 type:complete len:572 (-) comp15882_c0_seq1:38-1753(-)